MTTLDAVQDGRIAVREPGELYPLCPFCDAEVREVYKREVRGLFGRRYMYYCSSCRKVLGITHRKGFWMG